MHNNNLNVVMAALTTGGCKDCRIDRGAATNRSNVAYWRLLTIVGVVVSVVGALVGCQPVSSRSTVNSIDCGTQSSPASSPAAQTASDNPAETQRVPSTVATFDVQDLLAEETPAERPDRPVDRRLSLAEQRRQRDDTVWLRERQAQQYEQAIVQMWDRLLGEQRKGASGDQIMALAQQPLTTISVGSPGAGTEIGWGVTSQTLAESPRTITKAQWRQLAQSMVDAGYRIEQTEWHHAKFDLAEDGTARSTIRMVLYGIHRSEPLRWMLSGDLVVRWLPRDNAEAVPVIDTVDATGVRLQSRTGAVPFREVLTVDHTVPEARSGVQPVTVQDLDGDGLSEIVLGGANEIYRNMGGSEFQRESFLRYPERGFEVSLLADATGDGVPEYFTPGLGGDLLMYVADGQGKYTQPAKGKARGGGPLRQPQVITAGDVDNDGDLDLWIGQYRISYVRGQMPTPYYDANDGYEAYLLINDGTGKFSPAADAAGLEAKRRRRSYGGSLVDLDDDRDLDLLVVSDFAGIDVYLNDGKGGFTDVTDTIVDQRHLFGMSATFADYNVDGQLDFFVTGMASTTARRLEYMKLGRTDRPDVHLMRARMGYGNRMYLADSNSAEFSQPSFRDSVARTGWTWGSTSLDFDNDGRPDIFVANGHSSGESTKDHCSHFWCHDIYDGSSQPDAEVSSVFDQVMQGYYDRSESWDGYQKNQLLANLGEAGFVNVGYVLGVGHEYDGRAVISDDIDGDGRMDLLVVEDRWQDGQILHVYRNELDADNHWIGVRLVDSAGSNPVLGCRVIAELADGRRRVTGITAGDSIHAQHAATAHFGLGAVDKVERVWVQTVSGDTFEVEDPQVDKYHTLAMP